LTYLATTILTAHSLAHVLARKAAKDRSLISPIFGLAEELDGVIIGQVDQAKRGEFNEGMVLEMEHRRRSGRVVTDWYFLPSATKDHPHQAREEVILLDDHPLYRRQERDGTNEKESWEPESTFELGLTNRQRREREAVVLPYFDAQKVDGPGEGGRILYDMGAEDDFDDEEDEI
jgi:elongator complex protein 5